MDVNTAPTPTSRTTVVSLLIVGLLAIGLGVYQWYALYQMRMSGITPSCAISENIDCASVWNSPLADLAHHYTGLPFAGWGAAPAQYQGNGQDQHAQTPRGARG